MSEKTWVYWVGLMIVAVAIIGLVAGVAGLAPPVPRFHVRTGPAIGFLHIALRFAAVRIIGSLVLLATGAYMMISGKG